MVRKILLASIMFMTLVMGWASFHRPVPKSSRLPAVRLDLTARAVENMPVVVDDPFARLAYGGVPEEQREARFRRWLSSGVKISVQGASGSGTIVYYDPTSGTAYVQSCGHLWDGVMTAEQGKSRRLACKVITWYHNGTKLDSPKSYPAEVIYYSNVRGKDCSLLTFKPDWEPDYLPIAPEDYSYSRDMRLHSVGCDGGREIAHYSVRVIGFSGSGYPDLVTTENSPRPGRSGGGLSDDDYFVGICWGTSEVSGTGNGFFTPLKTLRELNAANGYAWLNDAGGGLARQIPIVDRNNPQQKYPKDYIPLPRSRP